MVLGGGCGAVVVATHSIWGLVGGGGGQYNISGTMDVDSCLKVHKHENFLAPILKLYFFIVS